MYSRLRTTMSLLAPGGRAIAVAVALSVAPSSLAWADFAQGLAAYNSGDYSAAFEEWRPLARAGDPAAQTALGEMYFSGRGMSPDPAEAAKWFRRAADQGHVSAQYALGLMYKEGTGLAKDLVRAYMWLDLATILAKGETRDVLARTRDDLAKTMTDDQITQAEGLAREWKAKPR